MNGMIQPVANIDYNNYSCIYFTSVLLKYLQICELLANKIKLNIK
jgi:hypothetical protein